MPSKAGFTLLEVLVAIGIIAALVAITIPAVVAIRESSRKSVCQQRLANMTRALTAFESLNGEFPASFEPRLPEPYSQFRRNYSAHSLLLGHLDQAALMARIDFEEPTPTDDTQNLFQSQRFGEIARVKIPAFLCPSDERASIGGRPGTNYRCCVGANVDGIGERYFDSTGDEQFTGVGPFWAIRRLRTADITDGLGQTVAFSERLSGSWNDQYNPRRDIWCSGAGSLNWRLKTEQAIEICASLKSLPAEFNTDSGAVWLPASFIHTLYTHAVGPNSRVPACNGASAAQSSLDGDSSPSVIGATSHHSGGVNTGFIDGHVRFISDSVDLGVWRAIATVRGNDPVGDDF